MPHKENYSNDFLSLLQFLKFCSLKNSDTVCNALSYFHHYHFAFILSYLLSTVSTTPPYKFLSEFMSFGFLL